MHQGVGIIIRNISRDSFFIQEKDETYPVEKYRNCFSLFGGKIEDGETPIEGLKRELVEEIELGNLVDKIDIHFIESFTIKNDIHFNFHLFEGILNDDDFATLSQKKVLEGRSKTIPYEILGNLKWIWGLEEVIEYYLQRNKN